MSADAQKRPLGQSNKPASKSKKGKKTRFDVNKDGTLNAPVESVRLIRIEEKKPDDSEGKGPIVLLSKIGKALQLQLSDDRLTVTGTKGYKTVRATHSVTYGSWYCEVTVTHLGKTGHCRLGWCTNVAELQAPVGYDQYGYSYRDLEGTKVNQACREAYGEPYQEGDVIGLYIHIPHTDVSLAGEGQTVVKYKGNYYYKDEPLPERQPLDGTCIAFAKNGVSQGIAFTNILAGVYFPAASIYTLPEQTEGASVTFNFGPSFKYPPPLLEGYPEPQPVSKCLEEIKS